MGWKRESQRHSLSSKGIKSNYTPEEIRIANLTSRTSPNKKSGVGTMAITPGVVRLYATKNDDILDFGSGKYPKYTIDLINEGYKNVTAYEFGDNYNSKYHNKHALDKDYDVIFASNVLNVQSTEKMLRNTLQNIRNSTRPYGLFIANYPTKPRKMNLNKSEMSKIIKDYFPEIKTVQGVWVMSYDGGKHNG